MILRNLLVTRIILYLSFANSFFTLYVNKKQLNF
nr:MAG TPA: hypothetical protein [Caudoviricetes sp.]